MPDTLVATIPKNSREEYRVTRGDYRGTDLVSLRVWYRDGADEMRPTAKGVAVKAGDDVVAIIAALTEANALPAG